MSNTLSKNQKELLETIKDSYGNDNLIPFIGAGFSKNANQNFPDWNQFVEKLFVDNLPKYFDMIKTLFPGGNYPIDAPEFYGVAKFREKNPLSDYDSTEVRKIITDDIQKIISDYDINITQSEAHELLVTMFPIIYTTNWDELIEEAMKHFCGGCNCISSLTKYFSEKDPKYGSLIKMHGSIGADASNMVATAKDYLDLLHNQHKNYPLNIKFQNESFHKDFLFIGFGFADPNINNLLYPIAAAFKKEKIQHKHRPKVYMLNFHKFNPIMVEYYKEFKNIEIYCINGSTNKTTVTINFLKELAK